MEQALTEMMKQYLADHELGRPGTKDRYIAKLSKLIDANLNSAVAGVDAALLVWENHATKGRTWLERGLRADQVAALLEPLSPHPEFHDFFQKLNRDHEMKMWVGAGVSAETLQRQTSYVKFLIASAPRSGTHMLRTLLMSHPNVEVHGESFNPYATYLLPYGMNDAPSKVLKNHIFRPYQEYTRAVGLCIHRDQPTTWGGEDVWDELASYPDLRILFVHRENELRRYVSERLTMDDKVWYLDQKQGAEYRENSKKLAQYEVDSDSWLEDMKKHERINHKFLECFRNHSILHVSYESMVNNTIAVGKQVQSFLDLPNHPIQTGTGRKDHRDLGTIISNFDDLKYQFKDSPLHRFFEESL